MTDTTEARALADQLDAGAAFHRSMGQHAPTVEKMRRAAATIREQATALTPLERGWKSSPEAAWNDGWRSCSQWFAEVAQAAKLGEVPIRAPRFAIEPTTRPSSPTQASDPTEALRLAADLEATNDEFAQDTLGARVAALDVAAGLLRRYAVRDAQPTEGMCWDEAPRIMVRDGECGPEPDRCELRAGHRGAHEASNGRTRWMVREAQPTPTDDERARIWDEGFHAGVQHDLGDYENAPDPIANPYGEAFRGRVSAPTDDEREALALVIFNAMKDPHKAVARWLAEHVFTAGFRRPVSSPTQAPDREALADGDAVTAFMDDWYDRFAGPGESWTFRDMGDALAEWLSERASPAVQVPDREVLASALMRVYDHGTSPNAFREADAVLALLAEEGSR